MTQEELITLMKREIAGETKMQPEEISTEESFVNLGLDSISGVYLLDKIEKVTGWELNPLMLWDYPTIKRLAEHLCNLNIRE